MAVKRLAGLAPEMNTIEIKEKSLWGTIAEIKRNKEVSRYNTRFESQNGRSVVL